MRWALHRRDAHARRQRPPAATRRSLGSRLSWTAGPAGSGLGGTGLGRPATTCGSRRSAWTAPSRRFVICHNPDQAHRDKALRDHPTLGRWLRQQPNGRLRIDRAKVKAEQRLDGKYLLATSDPDLSAEDVALGYKNLLEAERGFRDLKSQLLPRPVFHRLEHRIRAHVLLCWLALLLTRVAERSCEQTWRQINRETGRLQQVTLTGQAGTIVQTTPLRPTQRAIYQALSIDPPPRVSAFDPA